MSDILQIAIGLVIVGLVLLTVRRNGQANPEGTGKLSRQIGKLFADTKRMEEMLGNLATKAELGVVSGEIRALERQSASAADVMALKSEIAALQAQAVAIAKAADRTEDAVQRIEAILIKKALES